jgi:hypothetical protein
MTFYEELGVPQDASPDTIREAFRNVAKVLHPDAQTNPVLKQTAEGQMKRVNHLYEVLSDPERRRRYDQELAEPAERPTSTVIIKAPPPSEQFRPGHSGIITWIAATALCGTLIIWLATRESAGPAVYPQPAPPAAGASAPASPNKAALKKAAAALLPPLAIQDRYKDSEIARLRGELIAAYAERDRLLKQIASLQSGHTVQPAAITPAPLVATGAPVDLGLPVLHPVAPPPAAASKPRWTGSWTYGQRTENKNKTLFPPEFIETVITEDGGNLRGQYRARFKVADARISPDVDFRFEGKTTGASGRFAWTGVGGAKGEVQIRLISDSTLEVVWAATDLGKSMSLASGTAVLNRKN